MALYRLETSIIGRSAGKRADGARAYRSGSAIAAGAYRRGARTVAMTAEGRHVHDYSKKRGVIHTETLAPEGAPAWATNSPHLWQMVETAEKRKDAQLARELLITLPHNVPLGLCVTVLRDWLQKDTVALGMVADVAVHGYGTALDPKKPVQAERIAELRRAEVPIRPLAPGDLLRSMPPDGPHAWEFPDGKVLVYQPHAHVMLTMREIGPRGFGKKQRAWNSKAQLYRWRQSWELVYNDLLAAVGDLERVSAKAQWKRDADDPQQSGPASTPGASPKILRRQLNLDGGFYAAQDGRSATQSYGDLPMTAFEGNETERDLRRRAAEVEKREQAADRREPAPAIDRAALVRLLARMTELTTLGVEFVAKDDGGIRVAGATRHITEADKTQLNSLAPLVQPMLNAAPHFAPAPQLDDELASAMAQIDKLQSESGVRFFRTEKGALGFAPEGAVSPEIYRQFAGKHEGILTELERRGYAALWQEAQQNLQADQQKRYRAEEDAENLRRAHQAERQERQALEEGVTALIGSVQEGRTLPDVGDANPLLVRLKRTFVAVGKRLVNEKQRADRLQRTLDLFKKSFWSFVSGLIKRYPSDKAELERARDDILREAEANESVPQLANKASTDRSKKQLGGAADDRDRDTVQAERKPSQEERRTPPTKSRLHSQVPKKGSAGRPAKDRGGFDRD